MLLITSSVWPTPLLNSSSYYDTPEYINEPKCCQDFVEKKITHFCQVNKILSGIIKKSAYVIKCLECILIFISFLEDSCQHRSKYLWHPNAVVSFMSICLADFHYGVGWFLWYDFVTMLIWPTIFFFFLPSFTKTRSFLTVYILLSNSVLNPLSRGLGT